MYAGKIQFVLCMILIGGLTAGTSLTCSKADPLGQTQSKEKQEKSKRSSSDALIPPAGKLGQDLFMAIGRGDLKTLQSLLKRGADPNSRNSLEFTPLYLAAATGQTEMMDALLHAGAKLEASSPYGTALTQAAVGGNSPSVRYLLAKGASINAARPDGISTLMLVSRAGDPEVVREILKRKADVNARDNDKATSLIYAAREGRVEVGRMLLSSGASIDSADSHHWTPLMYAAVNGHPEFVRLLLENGAKPNTKDTKERTALFLSANYGDYPEVVNALLKGGADAGITDTRKRDAYAVAVERQHSECVRVLEENGLKSAANETLHPRKRIAKEAVRDSLKLIESSMLKFTKETGCISCHQDGLGRIATGAARDHGFALDPAVQKAQSDRINGLLTATRSLHLKALKDPEVMKQVPLIELDEVSTTDTWLLAGMAAHKQPANEAIGAMAMVLARQQHPQGSWEFGAPRVPMQSSFFTFTALAIRSMLAYAPKSYAGEVAERITRAKAWLLKTPTQTSEDRASRLLGLKWAGASEDELRKSLDELKADLHKDGGWSQLPDLRSDAYATGLALYALHTAGGLPTTDPVYECGVQFLLRSQEEDGSWFVNKRAVPANNYMDAGFPHGESQFSSFNGTCWATLALLQTIESPQGKISRAAP